MILFLFRHGIAEEIYEAPDQTDASRRLTPKGIQRTQCAAHGLAQIAPAPQLILTSPLIRAKQTADILGQTFDIEPQILDLLAQHDPQAIIKHLAILDDDPILIVGHEPTFSTIIETLCAPNHARPFIQLKKAACAALDLDFSNNIPRPGSLLFLAPPKLLRAAAPPII